MARLRWRTLGLAIVAFATLLGLREIAIDAPDQPFDPVLTFVVYLNRWTWLLVVLGWGHRLLNRPMGWLNYANRAVYPWYVLHQTFIVMVGVWLSELALGPALEPLALIIATVGGCAGIMYLAERWVPGLGTGIGLKRANTREFSRQARATTVRGRAPAPSTE